MPGHELIVNKELSEIKKILGKKLKRNVIKDQQPNLKNFYL